MALKKRISGSNHKIIIGNNTRIENPLFYIRVINNVINIGSNCQIGSDCSFWMEGDNIKITICEGTTFTRAIHINTQEDNSIIEIGKDCMLSNHISIRTSDSHAIISQDSSTRLNPAQDVHIGQHVWIAPDTKIMKGVNIGGGYIIVSNSILTKDIPSYCLAVGSPAKAVKSNISWLRDDIIFGNK